jgi:hypothetical protein
MNSRVGIGCAFAGVAALASSAGAQIILDGNMNSLAVGTAPDNGVAAGAWHFPANYIASGVAEPVERPGIFSIVPTNSFDPAGSGNSLRLFNPTGTGNDNYHLPNIWAQSFTAAPGLVLQVSFNFWVAQGFGGGSVYIGGDNGGGGFSNATGDRTAQLSWLPDGTIVSTNSLGQSVLHGQYPTGVWQNVRVDINTDARTWDLYWSVGANPLAVVGSSLSFRAPSPALSVNYDRITFVQFGGTVPSVDSYIDNIVVIPAPGVAGVLGLGLLAAAQRRRR